MIEGVATKTLTVNMDGRGYLMEIMRSDEDFFNGFGQCYLTTCFPGVIKAWHMHEAQEDNICCIVGNIKLVLSDRREDSGTYGEINEFFIGERDPILVKIPPGVYHGFMSLENRTAAVLNIPTRVYERDEPDERRLPYDSAEMDYHWPIDNR